MLTSTSVLTPSAAMPQAIDGPAASETPVSGAADFLALLGGAKASKKAKIAGALAAKPASTPTADAAAAKAEKTEGPETPTAAGTAGETGKAVVAAKTAVKAAAVEAKANGEAAKLQMGAEMSAAILAALGAFGKGSAADAPATAEQAAALPNAAPAADDAGKPKTRATRPSVRREGAETARPEVGTKAAEAQQPDVKPVKAEGERIAPAPPRPAEAAQPMLVTAQTDTSAQPAAQPIETQVTEARIPLASREAAQTGIAAPILAMRTVVKDGVAKSIEIRLDPAELGQVDVKLETGHDGKLQAVLSTESAEAFELLKKDSSALENALREAGIDLVDGAITFALSDSGADQSHQREAAYGGASARREAANDTLIAAAAAETSSWRHGVLDISV